MESKDIIKNNSDIITKINKDDIIYFLINKISELLSLNTSIKPIVYKNHFVTKLKSLNIFDESLDYKDKSTIISQIMKSEFQKIINSTYVSDLSEFISDKNKTILKMYNQLDECVYAIKKLKWKNDLILKEIRIMSKLYHRNIVRYHNVWVQSKFSTQMICNNLGENKDVNDKKYILLQMELCKYDLKQYLSNNKNLSLQNKLNICREICNGLAYIHSKKIVHMDIKPENILYGFDGLFKISDFGLSEKIESKKIMITDDFDTGGTFGYAAPELYECDSFTIKSDIYSLGMTFLYIFVNPFTMMEFLNSYKNLKSNKKIISPSIDKLLLNMLSIKDFNRPSIDAIIDRINDELIQYNKNHEQNLIQLDELNLSLKDM